MFRLPAPGSLLALTTLRIQACLAVAAAATSQARFDTGDSELLDIPPDGSEFAHAADLDGDGQTDVVTGIEARDPDAPHSLRLLFATAEGTLRDRTSEVLPPPGPGGLTGVRALGGADIDADGDEDLLLYRWTTGPQIYLNDGAGHFVVGEVARVSALDTGFFDPVFADLDADGDPDLVVRRTNSIAVFENTAGGYFRFRTAMGHPLQFPVTSGIAAADLDGDGHVDLTSGSTFTRKVHFGDGAFGFATSDLPIRRQSEAVAAADLDGDGDLDLVFATFTYGADRPRHELLWNDGNRTFREDTGLPPAIPMVWSMAVADFDGDGDPDLAFGGRYEALQLLRNDGGRFTELAPDQAPSFRGGIQVLAPFDLDGDGDTDLFVSANPVSGRLQDRVFLNDLGRLFDPGASFLEDSRFPRFSAFDDLDLDGDLDLVLPGGVGYLERDGLDGTGLAWINNRSLNGNSLREFAALADVNRDSLLDYLWIDRNGNLSLEVRDPRGNYYDQTTRRLPTNLPQGRFSVAAFADTDGDGEVELALGTTWGAPYLLLRNQGWGFFSYEPLDWPAGGYAHHIEFGDLDGDGDLDLVVGGQVQGGGDEPVIQLYRNDGSGRFREIVGAPAPGPGVADVATFALGDVDGDAAADIVTANRQVLHNDGLGGLSVVAGALPGAIAPDRRVQLVDLDDDGDLDVLAATDERNTAIFWNDGSGRFAEDPATFPHVPLGAEDHVIEDVDGDGDLDVLPTGDRDFGMQLLVNRRIDLRAPLPPRFGSTYEVELHHPDGRDAVVVFGLSLLPRAVVFPFGTQRIDLAGPAVAEFITLSSGRARSALPLPPPVPALSGTPLYVQALIHDRQGAPQLTALLARPVFR